MQRFLKNARAAAGAQGPVPKIIFVGNAAADADSIVASLGCALAWFLRNDMPSISNKTTTVVPVASLPRADLALRPDSRALFETVGFDVDQLIFRDEILLHEHDLLALVDHNRVRDEELVDTPVTAIFDHHADEGAHLNAKYRDVRTVGSCCTIAAEYLLALEGSAAAIVKKERVLLELLLGVILLDTSDLSPSSGKTTSADIRIVEQLLGVLGRDRGWATKELYSPVAAAKFSRAFWESLAPSEVLRVDAKTFGNFGVSSALSSLRSLPNGMITACCDHIDSAAGVCDDQDNGFGPDAARTAGSHPFRRRPKHGRRRTHCRTRIRPRPPAAAQARPRAVSKHRKRRARYRIRPS